MELKWKADRAGRLSSFLLGELHMSAGLMNKLKWGDALRVNGIPCRTNHPVQPGDVITVALAPETGEYPAQEGPLTILYEDEAILAVDKPAGMLIHPSRAQFTDTLANYVLGYYRKTGQSCAFHPMTRLDRDTFGVVLLGKNAFVHARLQDCRPKKTYHALTLGAPAAPEGRIEAPIARHPAPSLLRYVDPAGKPSVTCYQVLEEEKGLARLALEPVTGRTHQLRLHCAWMGCPILGDPQYTTREAQALSRQLGYRYQQLCAWQIEFPHPITGQDMCLRSEMDVPFPGNW